METRIKSEIKALNEVKSKVPHYSAFGDDNHKAIEAQIHVLETEIGVDDLDDHFDEDTDGYIYRSALDAIDWANGDNATVPSEDWAIIAK